MNYDEGHETIKFEPPMKTEKCPRCHRIKMLGKCEDGCYMCQSCWHKVHDMGALPSDSMKI